MRCQRSSFFSGASGRATQRSERKKTISAAPASTHFWMEHRHGDGGLGGAGDDLDHLGLDLVGLGADEAALVVRPLRVADDQILARTQAQHAHMLGVAAADDRHAALEVRSGHKKSRHFSKASVFKLW